MANSNKVGSIEEMAEKLAARERERPVHVYSVPPSLAGLGIRTIGLVELTVEEEMIAQKRGRNDAMRIASELAKESLRMIDGRVLSSADGSLDAAWAALHPKLRTLVTTAFNDLHSPTDHEAIGFLKSRQVVVR